MVLRDYLSRRYAPRWVILQIDILLSVVSFLFAYLLAANFNINKYPIGELKIVLPLYIVARVIMFRTFRIYRGITRYTSIHDAKKLFYSVTLGTIVMVTVNLIERVVAPNSFLLPLRVVFIDFALCMVLLTAFRISVKIVFTEISSKDVVKKNMAIFGAGRSGVITKRTIDHDPQSGYRVVVFFDDNKALSEKSIEGIPVLDYRDESFGEIIKKTGIEELIISIQNISPGRKQQIVDLCLKHGVEPKIVPPANQWVNGELSLGQIEKVKIEDLLEREPIRIDNNLIKTELNEKTVLVTGSAGSIGSELVRQIVKFYPQKVILYDQAETPLAEFERELLKEYSYVNFEFVMGDVRDKQRLFNVFVQHNPSIVFHVAAYKHVPMMEVNPSEAVLTNVLGTKNVADLANEFMADKFMMVSTDKAVNPTNVMGASKRIAEIYVQSLNYAVENKGTKYITTRFGNVLGSNGSVIPLFRKQISQGGPVTVTHPEITRYFMTIPEACQLILEAETMGNGGEIYIFDMGKDVKIADLARKMIKLSGFEPDKDIKISFTGLRPGEKIKEELLNTKENTLPTHHKKIMIGQVRKYEFSEVEREISKLITTAKTGDDVSIVLIMKSVVPEFVSNNSVFTELDKSTPN